METEVTTRLTRDQRETRRLLAAELLQREFSQSEVARRFGVSRTSASRWNHLLMNKGVAGLKKRRASGRPCRMDRDQIAALKELYLAGPHAPEPNSKPWTCVKFAAAILERFGIQYDADHVGRILHRLGLRHRRGGPEARQEKRATPAYIATPLELRP